MKRRTWALASAIVWFSGCCDEVIVARAFVGHKTLEECARLVHSPEQPVSLACPGSEVTICWGSKNVDKVKIDVSPDAEGQSGDSYASQGVLYLKPHESTTVKLSGSCTSTTKHIQVIDGPTTANFDANWDDKCSSLSYALDPNFVDPLIQTTDVTAEWEPVVNSGGTPMTCPTPPFLHGTHTNPPSTIFSFDILKPHVKQTFTSPQSGVTVWGYSLTACQGLGFKCNRQAAVPFAMTLVCPSS